MSSARRYQEDIRRIVGLQENGIGLEDDLPRMRIRGQRGVYQIGTGETKSGAAAGSEEETDTDESQEPEMPDESEEENGNQDGSGQGGSNTDAGATDSEEYQTDPDNPPSNTDTSSDAFGGNWASGGASDFVDCETNQCVQVVEGQAGYIDPEGYTPETMGSDIPNEPGYSSWGVSGGITVCAGSGYPSVASAVSLTNACYESQGSNEVIGRIELAGTNPDRYWLRMVNPETGFDTRSLGLNPSTNPADPSIQEPGEPKWPPDNCIQLAQDADGNFAASSRESPDDMTAKYSESKSQLDLCTPSGENVQVFKGKDGGNVRWNVNQQRWAASGPDGRYTRFGSSSSVQEQLAPNAGTPKAPTQN